MCVFIGFWCLFDGVFNQWKATKAVAGFFVGILESIIEIFTGKSNP